MLANTFSDTVAARVIADIYETSAHWCTQPFTFITKPETLKTIFAVEIHSQLMQIVNQVPDRVPAATHSLSNSSIPVLTIEHVFTYQTSSAFFSEPTDHSKPLFPNTLPIRRIKCGIFCVCA
jgi:hypothetical protein